MVQRAVSIVKKYFHILYDIQKLVNFHILCDVISKNIFALLF